MAAFSLFIVMNGRLTKGRIAFKGKDKSAAVVSEIELASE